MAAYQEVTEKLSACTISSSDEIIKKMAKPRQVVEQKRNIFIEIGVLPEVKGSAYMEFGNTKVRATIDGPMEITDANKLLEAKIRAPYAVLTCSVLYATFACTDEEERERKEKYYSSQLAKSLKPVILRDQFPNLEFVINANILDDDGCALSTVINCAGAAVVHSGIPIYDFIISSTIALYKDVYYINPDAKLELLLNSVKSDDKYPEYGYVQVSNMEVLEAITQIYQKGSLFENTFGTMLDMVSQNNKKVKALICDQIDREIKEDEELSANQNNEAATNNNTKVADKN